MSFTRSKLFVTSLVIAMAESMTACSPTINNHGFDREDIDFSKITPGVSTRENVQHLLGSPTSSSNFAPETWYYVSKKTSATAFFPADTLDQFVLEITFSPSGVVSNVRAIEHGEALAIRPVERQTPTAGHESSVLREVFSNFGRIAPKRSSPH